MIKLNGKTAGYLILLLSTVFLVFKGKADLDNFVSPYRVRSQIRDRTMRHVYHRVD